MQVATLEKSLGKSWRNYIVQPAAHSTSQPLDSADSDGMQSTLKALLVLRDVGISRGVSVETQRAVLERFRRLVYNFNVRNLPPSDFWVECSPTSLGSAAWTARRRTTQWVQAVDHVAKKLPESDGKILLLALISMPPPQLVFRQQPGLMRQWRFVLKLSEVEAFWNVHRRCPQVKPQAVQPGEAGLGQTLGYWRSRVESGKLHKVQHHIPAFSFQFAFTVSVVCCIPSIFSKTNAMLHSSLHATPYHICTAPSSM